MQAKDYRLSKWKSKSGLRYQRFEEHVVFRLARASPAGTYPVIGCRLNEAGKVEGYRVNEWKSKSALRN